MNGIVIGTVLSIVLIGCSIPDLSRPNKIVVGGVPVTISPKGGGNHDARPWAGNNFSIFCKWHPNDPSCWSERP